MRLGQTVLAAVVVCAVPSVSAAQECRRTCHADETRDANGCCIAMSIAAPPATTVGPIHCPAGSSWNDAQRRCVGRLLCPSGTHRDEGRGCVADVIACPTGTRNEEGRCVADVTCPAGATRQGDACVAPITCPPGSQLDGVRCLSSDVQCPAGSRAQPTGGCLFEPICPAGTTFADGRGCLGTVTCPPGSRFEGGQCRPEHVCMEGQQWVAGRDCVSVCEAHPHTQWDGAEHACVCVQGFVARAGTCAASDTCQAGFHREDGHCEVDIVCPSGYRAVRGVGCINPQLEEDRRIEQRARDLEAQEAQAARDRERQRRWTFGPALQLWAGGGAYWLVVSNVYSAVPMPGATAVFESARWLSAAPIVGVDFSSEGLVVGASYFPMIASQPPASPWSYATPSPVLHVITAEIGYQFPEAVHTPRLMVLAGGGLGGGANLFLAGLSYRSNFRLWRGLFLGFELRGMYPFMAAPFGVPARYDMMPANSVTSWTNWSLGGFAYVGYSIH